MVKEDIKFITTSNQPDWNETIERGVRERLFHETGVAHDFDWFSIYATLNASLIGGALFEIQGTILWVDALWVAPNFRKEGIGRKLFDLMTDRALQYNCQTIQLNTYFKDNLAFFKKQGFQEIASIPNWKYDLDCYFMRKKL